MFKGRKIENERKKEGRRWFHFGIPNGETVRNKILARTSGKRDRDVLPEKSVQQAKHGCTRESGGAPASVPYQSWPAI